MIVIATHHTPFYALHVWCLVRILASVWFQSALSTLTASPLLPLESTPRKRSREKGSNGAAQDRRSGLGAKHELEVAPETTVGGVKQMLAPITGLHAAEIKLIVKGKSPPDDAAGMTAPRS